MESFDFLGFSFNTLFELASIPIAIAGSESVMRFINRRCTGKNGVGSSNNDVISTQRIPAKLPDKR